MLRQPLTRALALSSPSRAAPLAVRRYAEAAPQPEKIEVFIDDKPVHVLPGTTILQVSAVLMFFNLSEFYLITLVLLNCRKYPL